MDNTDKILVEKAWEAMEKAYAPYSLHKVGAALLTKSGKIYTGCNIENASFSPTVCAERTAFFKAVSEGETDFVRIAVTGGKNGVPTDYFYPCGVCRQVMAEFCTKDFEIIISKTKEDCRKLTLDALLPFSFSPKNLED